jgi:hypothetical protein
MEYRFINALHVDGDGYRFCTKKIDNKEKNLKTERPTVDVLYLIRARIDTGRDKGNKQLAKDRRVLIKAEAEIVRLRQLNESPCTNE